MTELIAIHYELNLYKFNILLLGYYLHNSSLTTLSCLNSIRK